MTLGSASAICSVGLARLGSAVSFVGKVGADLWGDYCTEFLARFGVDTSLIVRDPALQTGLTISISSEADRALVTYLGAIRELRESDISDAMLARFGHLHVSSSCRKACARAWKGSPCKGPGLTTSLDTGFDPRRVWTDLAECFRNGRLLPTREQPRSAALTQS